MWKASCLDRSKHRTATGRGLMHVCAMDFGTLLHDDAMSGPTEKLIMQTKGCMPAECGTSSASHVKLSAEALQGKVLDWTPHVSELRQSL